MDKNKSQIRGTHKPSKKRRRLIWYAIKNKMAKNILKQRKKKELEDKSIIINFENEIYAIYADFLQKYRKSAIIRQSKNKTYMEAV